MINYFYIGFWSLPKPCCGSKLFAKPSAKPFAKKRRAPAYRGRGAAALSTQGVAKKP